MAAASVQPEQERYKATRSVFSKPNWIESWFRILKYDWLRFKDYVSFSQLERMIGNFIEVYNRLRYHGAIGYVTPEQKHSGEAETILLARSERRRLARVRRLEINRIRDDQI